MATAFTEKERAVIDEQLQQAAMQCAATLGMRRTTVDELARRVGISKGAFYHFYQSKEHLFLRMLETLHNEMYGNAERIFEERGDLSITKRTVLAIQEVCRAMEAYNLMAFMRDDLPTLLRRLPQELLSEHYQSDETRIRRLAEKANVPFRKSMDVTCTTVRLLLMTLVCKPSVGSAFDESFDVLIEGACERLVGQG